MSEVVMFEKGDEVIFKPVTPNGKSPMKFNATIFMNSKLETSSSSSYIRVIHYLKLNIDDFPNLEQYIPIYFKPDTNVYKEIYPSRYPDSIKKKIDYTIGLKISKNNNNELFMEITFNDYDYTTSNNNIVYKKQQNITSIQLNSQRNKLKTVRSYPKNKSIRLYQNKHNQPVKVNKKILEIEKKMEDFNTNCEDGIVKLNEELNAEIELQYGKQQGWFDDTIYRLNHKTKSKNKFSKRRTKSLGGKPKKTHRRHS